MECLQTFYFKIYANTYFTYFLVFWKRNWGQLLQFTALLNSNHVPHISYTDFIRGDSFISTLLFQGFFFFFWFFMWPKKLSKKGKMLNSDYYKH